MLGGGVLVCCTSRQQTCWWEPRGMGTAAPPNGLTELRNLPRCAMAVAVGVAAAGRPTGAGHQPPCATLTAWHSNNGVGGRHQCRTSYASPFASSRYMINGSMTQRTSASASAATTGSRPVQGSTPAAWARCCRARDGCRLRCSSTRTLQLLWMGALFRWQDAPSHSSSSSSACLLCLWAWLQECGFGGRALRW